MSTHPTAIVHEGTILGREVEIGPYAVIGKGVKIGDRCRIGPHACIVGPLTMGEECVVCFSAALGQDPQVTENPGPFGVTRIGSRNVFREFSQVNRSMKPDGTTVVGDDCFFMANSHAAHDCKIGDHVIMVNNATLGGHVMIDEWAIIGGLSAVIRHYAASSTDNVMLAGHVEVGERAFIAGGAGIHQFARVGTLAMVGGNASVGQDVPPYCMAVGGRPARLAGLNLVGLRRAGMDPATRRALKAAYRMLFRNDRPMPERIAAVEGGVPEVERLVEFVRTSTRGVLVDEG